MTQPLAYDLEQLAELLPLSKKQLYNAIRKTDRTTGVLVVAGVEIPIKKQGVRWIVWRSDIEAMRPVEKPKPPQPPRAKNRGVPIPSPVFQFVKE